MVVMSLKYQVRDLVNVTIDFGGRTFLILEVNENSYFALEMRSKKRYPLLEGQIEKKVGEVQPGNPLLSEHLDQHDEDAAEVYCNLQARTFPEDKEKWLFLAKLKAESSISLVHRKTIYPATFVRINIDKPLYPIRAKIKGLTYDFRLSALTPGLQTIEGVV